MSAGIILPTGAKEYRDLGILAPHFRDAVTAAVEECHDRSLDVMIWETYRSAALQAVYYERGRTVKPPDKPVTNARSNLFSWHGYGLAVDVISESKKWGPGVGWFAAVAAIFKQHQCKWGGDWKQKDYPHFQWYKCRASPSDRARELLRDGGVEAVWRAVGAL